MNVNMIRQSRIVAVLGMEGAEGVKAASEADMIELRLDLVAESSGPGMHRLPRGWRTHPDQLAGRGSVGVFREGLPAARTQDDRRFSP